MQWIAGETLSSAGSITFSNIPSTFTHLQIRITGRSTFSAATASAFIRFNGDTGNNYPYHNLTGDGSSATSYGTAATSVGFLGNFPGATSTANVFASAVVDILDYANTNKNKVVRSIEGFDANGSGQATLASSLWLNTAAITSILLISGGGANFVIGTRADLYGITVSDQTGA